MLIIDRAPDLPFAFEKQLLSWGEGSVVWRERSDGRGVARAVNVYSGQHIGEGHQSFRYITPPVQLTLADIAAQCSTEDELPEWVHVVVRLPRAVEITIEAAEIAQTGIKQAGHAGQGEAASKMWRGWRPNLAWEPLGVQSMGAEELQRWIQAARRCAIVSPNLLEAQTILASASSTAPSQSQCGSDVDASTDRAGTKDQGGLEELKRTARALFRLIHSTPACRPSQQPDTFAPGSSTADPACPVAQDADVGLLTDSDRYQQPILIVRAGSLGSYTISNDSYLTTKSDGSGTEEFHTPAYWRKGEQGSVIDPTGGGNAFMGGLCAGMIASGGDIREACLYGAVAASFAIQQRGLTSFAPSEADGYGTGLWNGDEPSRRLAQLRNRISMQ